jgi:hypothetical protein
MKLPAFQFYPADWRKDPGVQALSYHDRGVWFEILCLMHESEQRGKLLLNGAPMPEDALARLLGLDKQNLTKTLTTLLSYGVVSRDDETGAFVNRRMVRDEAIRKMRQEVGKRGGNPNLVNQKSNQNPEPDLTKSQPFQSSSSTTKKDSAKAGKKPPGLWDVGESLLEASGVNDPRKYLGKLSQQYGKENLAQAIATTAAANPADPKAYIVKVLQGMNGNQGGQGRPVVI